MSRAVVSVGSNLGDRQEHLRSVVAAFGDRVRAISPIYRTPPWGGVEQQDFLNAVLIVDDSALDCHAWLRWGQRLEDESGRIRAVRWGPRTLDVDIVDCDGVVNDDPDLTLPHPHAHHRAFVLVPWLDVEPDAILAGRPVASWIAELDPTEVSSLKCLGALADIESR